jgi:multimeric flavodoxin WrbA
MVSAHSSLAVIYCLIAIRRCLGTGGPCGLAQQHRAIQTAQLSSQAASGVNVLVVYADDQYEQIGHVADAVASGASSVSANVRCLQVQGANYKRDVLEWADAVILGSGVYNGNAYPTLLEFINSFDFLDDLSGKVGGAFCSGGAAAAGLQPVLNQLSRGLRTFGMVVVGGKNWKNAEGTGVVTNGTSPISSDNADLLLAMDEGARVATVAAALKTHSAPKPAPGIGEPPAWGENWTATVYANMTQVGYDAGLVIVNFSGYCPADPFHQKMKTVYGDFDTVLTRCDLGREFIIDPPSRGGKCRSREIGSSANPRICQACSCPFCVRDTNGSFSHGEELPSNTQWFSKEDMQIGGIDVVVWKGTAASSLARGQSFNLNTTIAYLRTDGVTPVFVNVSHPLWVQTTAAIENFRRSIDPDVFDIPDSCFRSSEYASYVV